MATFDVQDVARLQPALSALPAHPSPNQPLLHHQQPAAHYSQVHPFQGPHVRNPHPNQNAGGPSAWPRPLGLLPTNQV